MPKFVLRVFYFDPKKISQLVDVPNSAVFIDVLVGVPKPMISYTVLMDQVSIWEQRTIISIIAQAGEVFDAPINSFIGKVNFEGKQYLIFHAGALPLIPKT